MRKQGLISRFVRGATACLLACMLACVLSGCQAIEDLGIQLGLIPSPAEIAPGGTFDFGSVPEYAGAPSVEVNGGVPFFEVGDLEREIFEEFSPLDDLGRCGVAFALVGPETMPDVQRRGSIGMVKPSGWKVARYEWIDGMYLFNRCHLIGYQLTGQNDNELNLITGTRSLNVQGMEPYENRVANYIYRTNGHVLYRVTPYFTGNNLVADGVLMEALSVDDHGEGVKFCVWCYNVEPGVMIDYATGESVADGTISHAAAPTNVVVAPSREEDIDAEGAAAGEVEIPDCDYVLNTNSMKFHRPDCEAVHGMQEHNKRLFYGTREEAIELGFEPCGVCKP